MNKISLLLLSIVLLFCISCKKETEEITKATYSNIPNNNPTSYLLKSQIWSGPSTNGGGFFYYYNSDNQVYKIKRHQWGTGSSNGGPVVRWDDTTYYYFEYTNGLCTKWTIDDHGSKGYYTYDYNAQNLPYKRTTYGASNMVQGYCFYKYDKNNNLIERKDSSYQLNFRYDFTYDSNNNLTSVTDNILWSNPQQKMKYEFLTHDQNVNFIKAVNGLPITFIWDNNYHSYSSSSPNNFLTQNYYVPVDANQPFGQPRVYNYSYDYNDEGLPVKMEYSPWLVTFTYQKYK